MATKNQRPSLRNEDAATEKLNDIIQNSRLIDGAITRFILNITTVNDGEKLKRVKFGGKDENKPHKTILLVGETGMGKSTLINAVINYMLGVESNDRIWFEITETKDKQTRSQTKAVIVYDVFTEHGTFSLTFIDTPGFGSTEGLKEDLNVAESLLELFTSKDGVHEIDAVCFVVTSNTFCLTDRQHYVFNVVLSLFGNDVEKNIVMFITHAARKPNNTIKAIKESQIPCAQTDGGDPVYFRFDNSHCENFNDEEILEDYEASWKLLNSSMEKFLEFLEENKPINVTRTVAVLKHRKQLTAAIFHLKEKIRWTELKQKELEQTEEALKQLDEEKSNNFEYEVDEVYKVKLPIECLPFGWNEATCCNVCKENCHYPGCWWATDLSWCTVMSKGKCTVCTGRCHYTDHVKEGKMYVTKTRKVKKTNEDLKKKYETKSGEKKSLMSHVQEEIREMEKTKIRLVDECYECVLLLDAIALKTDSVYTLQHLDFMIEKIKETGNTDRVKRLEEMKERADEQSFWAIEWFGAMQNVKLMNI